MLKLSKNNIKNLAKILANFPIWEKMTKKSWIQPINIRETKYICIGFELVQYLRFKKKWHTIKKKTNMGPNYFLLKLKHINHLFVFCTSNCENFHCNRYKLNCQYIFRSILYSSHTKVTHTPCTNSIIFI